jgi:selenocysteine lyase/cysteine desulfurase
VSSLQKTDRRRFLEVVAAGAGGAFLTRVEGVQAALTEGSRRVEGHLRMGFSRLSEEYLLSPDILYLNHASIGTVPRVVHEAHAEFAALCESNPWLYMWGGAWEAAREEVREAAARLLGAPATSVAITHNTTEGFNVLARGLPLGPGDEVVFTDLNHAGASIPFETFSRERGYTVRRVPFPLGQAPTMTSEEVVEFHESALTTRTRLLVLPHLDNMVGIRHPLPEIAAMARSRGVEFVAVDGAQSAGMIPMNLVESGVDFFSASPHKWIQSPKGLGLLYVREDRIRELTPFWVTWGQERWSLSARRFEDYGTRNLPELLALGEALHVQEDLDAAGQGPRYEEMHGAIRRMVEEAPRIRWRSPDRYGSGGSLYAIEVLDVDAAHAGRWLQETHGVMLRPFTGPELNFLRVSPNLMTTDSELTRFMGYLEQIS